jgi:iron-sulfur cluster assembly protein|tara:strand:+ start:424 stop:765 length:342 start_codon:yes stop_codon:yes gene_type:complete
MQSFNPSSISFTDAAVSHFKNSLNDKPESFGIRIGVRESGCSGYEYFFEYTNEEQEGDTLFDKSSFKIYVDSNSFEFLKGSEVDFVSTGLNQGIIFNNPNAKVTCGCGESFSI